MDIRLVTCTDSNAASFLQLVNVMLQSQFNFVNIMIQPLDHGTNCVTVQTKPGQFMCACLFVLCS